MHKIKKRTGRPLVPPYAVLPLLSCVGVNCIVYYGAGVITESWKHYDFTTAIDRAVPVIPEFVSVYLGCYIFWILNYIIIARQGKEYCMRFVLADMMSRLLCAVFFLLIPTTNIRPEILGSGIWPVLLRQVYHMDAPAKLFPSIHCLVSWFCFIGIRGRKNIPRAYRVFSCLFAILVFVSTQVTKQHYLIDIAGAVVIAESCFYLSFHTGWYRAVEKVFDKITDLWPGRIMADRE